MAVDLSMLKNNSNRQTVDFNIINSGSGLVFSPTIKVAKTTRNLSASHKPLHDSVRHVSTKPIDSNPKMHLKVTNSCMILISVKKSSQNSKYGTNQYKIFSVLPITGILVTSRY